jgi:hypothetical protein
VSAEYVRAVRAPDTTFRACGFRGCTSFASHVLYAGSEALCFCCGQCAAAALNSSREPSILREALRRLRNDETVRGIEQVKIMSKQKSEPPKVLPLTLPVGVQTLLFTDEATGISFRWTLHGEATLRLSSEYAGDWRCEGRKSTSFVRYTIVDWDQLRAGIPSSVADSKKLSSTDRDT